MDIDTLQTQPIYAKSRDYIPGGQPVTKACKLAEMGIDKNLPP
jgi:hypothetical protein